MLPSNPGKTKEILRQMANKFVMAPQENCTYAKIPGTCFMGRTDVELYMKLEKNVYQLGDKIPVHVEVTVKGSSKVDRVSRGCDVTKPILI